jgi:hypothetical protein
MKFAWIFSDFAQSTAEKRCNGTSRISRFQIDFHYDYTGDLFNFRVDFRVDFRFNFQFNFHRAAPPSPPLRAWELSPSHRRRLRRHVIVHRKLPTGFLSVVNYRVAARA